MITMSNSLSIIRAPLAFLFLQDNSMLRILAIVLAMVTDSIDGYFARRNQSVSQFGAILDPAMDKFFVYFAIGVLVTEGKMATWEMAAMVSRDFFVCLYGFFKLAKGRWKSIVFRSIRWGKITTALQFVVLISLVSGISIPWYLYGTFVLMGWMAFLELLQEPRLASEA